MIVITETFTVQKFFQYCGAPKRNKYNNTYQGSCPICREGKSWLKKRRCFYIPKNNNIYCHNCGWSSVPYNWIKRVTGNSDLEIIQEVKQSDNNESAEIVTIPTIKKLVEDLPVDSINLFDNQQLDYFKDDKIIQQCIKFIHERRLDTAVNRPNALYISLKDFVHKDRLVIPFYNEHNKIEFYQTRTVITNQKNTKPKYISKVGGEKTLYGMNNIDNSNNSAFIFEGPINAMFVSNGVAVAGIQKGNQQFTPRQAEQIKSILNWFNRIWVLDSQWIDNTSLIKTEKLINQGEKVFLWPEKFGKCFKDFNEICMKYNLDEISQTFIVDNTFDKLTSLIKLSEMKSYSNFIGSGT